VPLQLLILADDFEQFDLGVLSTNFIKGLLAPISVSNETLFIL